MTIPLLKKKNLASNLLNNYRPVSNLLFISKILEKIEASRYEGHLTRYSLHEPYQSAHRVNHSTETTRLRVKCEIANSLNKHKSVLMVLLLLSTAFDTVDHKIIISRSKKIFRHPRINSQVIEIIS